MRLSVCHPDVDLLICTATSWPAFEAGERPEAVLGRPVGHLQPADRLGYLPRG